jgi:hypothetical protein
VNTANSAGRIGKRTGVGELPPEIERAHEAEGFGELPIGEDRELARLEQPLVGFHTITNHFLDHAAPDVPTLWVLQDVVPQPTVPDSAGLAGMGEGLRQYFRSSARPADEDPMADWRDAVLGVKFAP